MLRLFFVFYFGPESKTPDSSRIIKNGLLESKTSDSLKGILNDKF